MTSIKAGSMDRPNVYITRQIPQKGLDTLLRSCNVSLWDSPDPAPRTELLRNVINVNVLLCMPTDQVDVEVLNAAGPLLRIVATMSEDSRHIDVEECERRNIRVLTLRSVSTSIVADLALGSLLMATRNWIGDSANMNRFLQSADIVKALQTDSTYCQELSNRIIGIYGMDPLGMALAKKLRQLGVSHLIYTGKKPVVMTADVNATFADQETFVTTCDVIFICSDYSQSQDCKPTHIVEVFNKETFGKMKSTAVLIDAGKRTLTNFTELYEALRSGEIAAAGLDVREYDVIQNRHPLGVLENCHFLPYKEVYKWDGRRRMSEDIATQILGNL